MTKERHTRLLLMFPMAMVVLPSGAHAQSEVRVSADTSANIGYSTNPFSEPAGHTGSGVAQIEISPQVQLVTERSVFTLSGTGEYQRYFRRYGTSSSYGTGLDYRGTPSERVKTHLNFRYDSSIIGGNNFVSGVIDPTLPQQPILLGTDISLFGTRDRVRTLRGAGDVTYALSARDQLTASAYYIRSRYSQFGALGNNDGYGGSIGYSRQVTEHLQLGAQGSIARYDYQGLLGSTTVYSPQLSFSATLGPRWTADGALGVSFVDATTRGGRTSLSGNLRLCRRSPRSNFCLTAQRAVLAAGISGTQNVTSAGATYSYRISERGTIIASADYERNGSNQPLIISQNEYLRGSLGYERVLRQRVRLIISSHYREVFGGIIGHRADYGGQIGVRIRFGDTR